MQNTPDNDSRSPPQSGGVITRAQSGPGNDTALPSLTGGFGAVMEKEHDLRPAIEGSFGDLSRCHSAETDRSDETRGSPCRWATRCGTLRRQV